MSKDDRDFERLAYACECLEARSRGAPPPAPPNRGGDGGGEGWMWLEAVGFAVGLVVVVGVLINLC